MLSAYRDGFLLRGTVMGLARCCGTNLRRMIRRLAVWGRAGPWPLRQLRPHQPSAPATEQLEMFEENSGERLQ